MPDPIDYRALIQDRKAKDRRPIVRHIICLDPELFAELEEAQEELQEEIRATIGQEDDSQPRRDRRAGGLSPRSQIESRIEEIEGRIAAASIVGVFKAYRSDVQNQHFDELEREREANPDQANALAEQYARKAIVDTFQHFEGPHRSRLDLTVDDLRDMLETWTQGEVTTLGNKITRASVVAHEAPKSARQLLLNQRSDATSNSHSP